MANYRRNRIAGGTYFFTVVTFGRKPILTSKYARDCLREVWRITQEKHPFELEALCLLPDHLHCIWTLPQEDSNYSIRWAMIKSLFTKNYLQHDPVIQQTTKSRISKGEASIWQRRYWEHTIRDKQDYNNHVDYIHYNPVKHGLVTAPIDWEYSTFKKFVEKDIYPMDWGMSEPQTINVIKDIEKYSE